MTLTPSPRLKVTLPAEPASVAFARRVVHEAAERSRVRSALVADAELVATELVTNALTHGQPPITLEVRCTEDAHVHIEVGDTSPAVPERRAHEDGIGGYGLPVVEGLTETWGVKTDSGRGKTVWCVL